MLQRMTSPLIKASHRKRVVQALKSALRFSSKHTGDVSKPVEQAPVVAKPAISKRAIHDWICHAYDEEMARCIQRRYRGRSKRLQLRIRRSLAKLPNGVAERACAGGMNGIAKLVCESLGPNVWQRAVYNAPDEWEEREMLEAMVDAILYPMHSTCLWLLAQPTKFERLLLAQFCDGATRKATVHKAPFRTVTFDPMISAEADSEAAMQIGIWRRRAVRDRAEECRTPASVRGTVVGTFLAVLLGDLAARAVSCSLLSADAAVCALLVHAVLLCNLGRLLAKHVGRET